MEDDILFFNGFRNPEPNAPPLLRNDRTTLNDTGNGILRTSSNHGSNSSLPLKSDTVIGRRSLTELDLQQSNDPIRNGSGHFEQEPYSRMEGQPPERRSIIRGRESSTTKLLQDNETSFMFKINAQVDKDLAGYLFKHNNYVISSSLGTVKRRYSDFLALKEYLAAKYPGRTIPSLPPKKILGGNDDAFLLRRSKGLERFLQITANHPVLSADNYWKSFITASEEFEKVKKPNIKEIVSAVSESGIPFDKTTYDAKRKNNSRQLELIESLIILLENECEILSKQSLNHKKISKCLETLSHETEDSNLKGKHNQVAQFSLSLSECFEDKAKYTLNVVLENIKKKRDIVKAFEKMSARVETLHSNYSKEIKAAENKVAEYQGTNGSDDKRKAEADLLTAKAKMSNLWLSFQEECNTLASTKHVFIFAYQKLSTASAFDQKVASLLLRLHDLLQE